MAVFQKTDILFPKAADLEKWSVIACDQFTSQPEYWDETKEKVGDAPSTLNLIFPEAWLGQDEAERTAFINETMDRYLEADMFQTYQDSYVYVERTLTNGTIRKGLVGAVDLDAYDFSDVSTSEIRATERTVIERIPPRKRIRKNASLELPHVILLCDDDKRLMIESVEAMKEELPVLYELDLMQRGGHIKGWLVNGEAAKKLDAQIEAYVAYTKEKYEAIGKAPMYFAMGDGNHSLATAKSCYEDIKAAYIAAGKEAELVDHPARYALLELENIHDEAQQFEAIHRIVKVPDVDALIQDMKENLCVEKDGLEIILHRGEESWPVYLDPARGELPIGVLQEYLDEYLPAHEGLIDYIHGEDTLIALANKENCIGFEVPPIDKNVFFVSMVKYGVLPRKTFSMGHAWEKRYYMEARKIKK